MDGSRIDERRLRLVAEKVTAWVSIAVTLVGLVERANHYFKIMKKAQQSKKHPLGFRP